VFFLLAEYIRRRQVAGRSRFLKMIVPLTLVGAYGFRITPAMIVGLTVIGLLMLAAWWTFMRERARTEVSRGPSLNHIRNLAR
jgi:hypothetical protein